MSRPQRRAPRAPSSETVLGVIVAVLCLIGLVMVLSASSVSALQEYGSSWVFFARHVMWLALGTVVLVVAARVDYRLWCRAALPLVIVSMVALALVLLPGVGITVGGSTRWLGTPSWRVQPSELAKFAVVVFAAERLARGATTTAVRVVLAMLATAVLLVMRQPDLGTALVIAAIVLAVLWVAGTPGGLMVGLGAVAVVSAVVAGMVEPYRRARLMSFLDPWAHAADSGYQVVQSLVGLGTGRVTGVGVGASRAKWGFLPNAHTDFIFSIIGEELGLVGTLGVVALFAGFAVLGIRAALRAPDRFGTLLAAGITAWVVAQAVANMGVVVGYLPVTGVPLPFVSFGGSSLVILMVAAGVLLNIAGQGRAGGVRHPGPAAARARAGARGRGGRLAGARSS